MADVRQNCPTNSSSFNEAVCIDAGRVYDSCCDRDCITDMKCYFSKCDQHKIDCAINVRIRSARVVDVSVDVEPVTFNRGFYACDLSFVFMVDIDIVSVPGTCPETVHGLCFYNKKAILYGSEGNVKTFTSTGRCDEKGKKTTLANNGPKCVVQVVDPVALSARLSQNVSLCDLPSVIPDCACDALGGEIETSQSRQCVLVTLGLFTVVQLIRNVQMLVPVYDFCIPEKQCDDTTDSPCDVFKRIKFPTDDFFPPRPCDVSGGCGCSDTCGCDDNDD